jgi:hypothetical protein
MHRSASSVIALSFAALLAIVTEHRIYTDEIGCDFAERALLGERQAA